MEEKRALIVLNPCSGTRQANKYLADIIDLFCKSGYESIVATTGARGDGTEIVKRRYKEVDLIVCIGGDGTFNEVAAGVMETGFDKPIGYIPAGSTNDFAASMGLSKDILQAARDIVEGQPKAFDMGSFNGRYFSYVASFGAFTRASYEAPQSLKNSLGHLAYILQGIKDLPNIKKEHLHIVADNIEYDEDFIFGAVSNSTSLGGILTLDSMSVDMSDGLFEVLLIKAPSNLLELNQIAIALSAMDYNSAMIKLFSSKKISIEANPEMPWTLDGEFQPGSEKIEVENVPHAISLIVPVGDDE